MSMVSETAGAPGANIPAAVRAGLPPGENEGADAESAARQFVIFFVRGETFAVPLSEVQEIIRMPDVVRLPLSPPSLEGLANLRGTVLPILNLRRIFGFEECLHDDATRVVVLDQGRPIGFVVDRMANVVTVEGDQIETAASIRSTVDTDLLTGMIKNVAGQAMVMILDAGQLVSREFRSVAKRIGSSLDGADAGRADDGKAKAKAGDGNDEIQLVSFEVCGQEYALPIESVQEIVQLPETQTHVPNVPAYVLGVMTLRARLLPLVSLRGLFGLELAPLSEQHRVVVVSLRRNGASVSVGVVVDSVKEVLRVSRGIVDPIPALLAKDKAMEDITSICRLDGGKRLVSIISAEHMILNAAVRQLLEGAAGKTGDSEAMTTVSATVAGTGKDDEEQFVVFRLNNEEYGVTIDAVQEIVRVPEQLTHIPKTPSFIEGVVNLRGTVLPVIDQRRRFGLPECERNDRQRIMVFTVRGVRTGFIVDSVSEVMRIPRSTIGPAPNLSEEQQRIIQRVANLEKMKRMILLLDVSQLLEAQELKTLEKRMAG